MFKKAKINHPKDCDCRFCKLKSKSAKLRAAVDPAKPVTPPAKPAERPPQPSKRNPKPKEDPGEFEKELEKEQEKEVTELVVEAQNIIASLETVKPLYSRLDAITLILKNHDLRRHGLAVVDNFAEKNSAFKTVGIRRYELKRIV